MPLGEYERVWDSLPGVQWSVPKWLVCVTAALKKSGFFSMSAGWSWGSEAGV